MPNQLFHWAPLEADDIEAVDFIADGIHTGLPERIEVFAEKIALYNSGCWKFCSDTEIVGYGLSHPWLLRNIPPLDEFLVRLPRYPDCLYVHDVAILPSARGHGSAGQYIEIVSRVARDNRISHLACVSVYGTDTLWSRYGFRVITDNDLVPVLSAYGATAKYMIADL